MQAWQLSTPEPSDPASCSLRLADASLVHTLDDVVRSRNRSDVICRLHSKQSHVSLSRCTIIGMAQLILLSTACNAERPTVLDRELGSALQGQPQTCWMACGNGNR